MIHYLDTQVVVWLCQGNLGRMPKKAIASLEASDLLVSPMVTLELQYLYEIGRIVRAPQMLLGQLEAQIGAVICAHPFPSVMATALLETWTRDPFDRVIVAHARSNKYAPLITSDTKIHENYSMSVWS